MRRRGMGPGPRRRPGPARPVRRGRAIRRRRVRRRRILLVGGLVAFGVHKMSKKDADRIQAHTGIPPEDLEDADLEQAMQELGIPKQTVTAQDEQAAATGSTAAPTSAGSAAGSAAPAGAATGGDLLDQLAKLGQLRDAGVLTEEEFAAQKAKLLAG